MNGSTRKLRCLLLLALPLLVAAGQAVAAETEPPTGASPVPASELLLLYGGKTWKWGEGGAYFAVDGRKFTAKTSGETGETSATGTWKITDSGKLCFTATWGADETPTETCFLHVTSAGDIYQRRLPDGGWYVFKHANLDPADEYGQLVRKDLVSGASTTN